jgi:hypothetical protein
MVMEKLLESDFSEQTELLGENLLQNHFIHHMSPLTLPRIELDRSGGK